MNGIPTYLALTSAAAFRAGAVAGCRSCAAMLVSRGLDVLKAALVAAVTGWPACRPLCQDVGNTQATGVSSLQERGRAVH